MIGLGLVIISLLIWFIVRGETDDFLNIKMWQILLYVIPGIVGVVLFALGI